MSSLPSTPTSIPLSIHQRRYETEAFAEADGTMRVVGRLVDTKPSGLSTADGEPLVIHDMTIELMIAMPSFEIVDVGTQMDVHPYGECPEILDSYRQLIGVPIARGYTRKVRELFGQDHGCSHMGALLVALGPVAVQASWSMSRLHADPTELMEDIDPGEIDRQLGMNLNTCHIWSDGGTQVAFLKRGERPVRPQWEIERLATIASRSTE